MTVLRGVSRWCVARWRQSLVLSITLIGMGAVAVVAIVVSDVVGSQIRTEALSRARATAEVLARSTFAPKLSATGRLTPAGRADVAAQVRAARASQPGAEVVLRDPRGRLLYGSGGSPARRVSVQTGTRVDGSGDGRRVRSSLPIRARSGGALLGYLELEVPYAPVAREIERRTGRLEMLLVLMALAIYALALPTLIRAGRVVRSQYDPRLIEVAHDVKAAIRRDELSLAYQPIVDASTGELRSLEALLRWTDPRRGPISPGLFVPAVEQTSAIWELTDHVFERAFRQVDTWCGEGRRIRVALNLSGAVLLDRRLVPRLRALAAKYRVPPAMIELEITEGALVQDPREATRVLEEITSIGLRVIAIDDFGTGYSSLARLHELPLDTLKIDQSFVMRMAQDGDTAIVRSVVELAHALRLDVIAEGVEDERTADRLRELGAEYLQGFGISRPLSASDVTRWIDEREPAVA